MGTFVDNVTVRQYRDDDREEVRRVCCETGFLGCPIDPIYQDRELFADLFTKPYLDYEPECTLVVESEGRIAGYLTGSVCPSFQRTLMLSGFQTACKMVGRLLAGKYSDHPRSEQFVRWLLRKGLMEQPKHPENAGHLHMNLERPLRWGWVARRLLSMYEYMLFSAELDHYYVKFFSCSQRNPERMYHRLKFEVYDRVPSTIFHPEIPSTFYVVCAHKKLNGAFIPPPMAAPRRGSSIYHYWK
ncbi:MAG: hypothetical protein P8X65_09045 [Syntrophobacterales bacterium]